MEDGGGESGQENRKWRKGILVRCRFSQEKGEGDEKAKNQSREEGMTVSAIEGEEGGRAGKFAEHVDVGDGSGDEHGDCDGASEAGKSGAF